MQLASTLAFLLDGIYAALEGVSERGNNLNASGVSMNKASQIHNVTVLIISDCHVKWRTPSQKYLYMIAFPAAATAMDKAKLMNRIK